jgi:hypothetical protein
MTPRRELPPAGERLLVPAPSEPGDPVRESWILPAIFLTVALLGGFRTGPDGSIRLLPPPLISMVLAMVLLGVLVRAAALDPLRLMSAVRTPSENLSGLMVLATLFAASAQLLNAITPETGLLHLLMNVFLLALLANTAAAAPDPPRLLRSLAIVFGSAFVLKYILLAALYDPQGGLTRRVLTALVEGVTLGTMDYQLHGQAVGYVAFSAIVVYMIGLFLLPRGEPVPARRG